MNLLDRCLELAPGFAPARYNYAVLLQRNNDAAGALVQVERLLAIDPRNPGYRNLHAVILSHVGEYRRALEIYAELLREYPAHSKVWLSYGHVLKTDGRLADSIAAYRQSIACEHGLRRSVLGPCQPQDLPFRGSRRVGNERPAGTDGT